MSFYGSQLPCTHSQGHSPTNNTPPVSLVSSQNLLVNANKSSLKALSSLPASHHFILQPIRSKPFQIKKQLPPPPPHAASCCRLHKHSNHHELPSSMHRSSSSPPTIGIDQQQSRICRCHGRCSGRKPQHGPRKRLGPWPWYPTFS